MRNYFDRDLSFWALLICHLVLALSLTHPALAKDRPSLKALSSLFQRGPEITQAFKKSVEVSETKGFIKDNQKVRSEFAASVKASESFVRGEIEDEKVLNFITNFLQLSILKIRSDLKSNNGAEVGSEVTQWFNFAADLSYEESSLIGLRLSNVIRSLLLDELETASRDYPKLLADSGSWLKALRAPWPVDRVFLYESKRVLKPRSLMVAEKVTKAFQKNPYQTAEQILKKTPGGAGEDLEFLKSIWRESDLKAMKTEINRLGLLRARAADLHFEAVQKKQAAGWQDLRNQGGLEAIPTDYFTGRPMEWSKLTATRMATESGAPTSK
jgi:hypothetical protein